MAEPARDTGPLELRPFGFDSDGVRAVVTTATGGFSSGAYDSLNLGDHVGDDPALVRLNRDRVAEALGVPALTIADQQHTGTVARVTLAAVGAGHAGAEDARHTFAATDALVTDVPGAALATLVADCAPVVLHDPVRRAIGAAHCGRRGVQEQVLAATVAAMGEHFGSDPADLRAGVGPCVARESYEVGDAEAAELEALLPGRGLTSPSRPGHALLDLGGAVEAQLADLGVGHVERLRVDTRTSADYFSDRRLRPCGRFAAVVVLTG